MGDKKEVRCRCPICVLNRAELKKESLEKDLRKLQNQGGPTKDLAHRPIKRRVRE